eukprot:4888278-Karenia_brevis.AAC.1
MKSLYCQAECLALLLLICSAQFLALIHLWTLWTPLPSALCASGVLEGFEEYEAIWDDFADAAEAFKRS